MAGAVQGMRAEEVVRDRDRDAAIERYAEQKAAVEEQRGRVAAERAAAKEAHRQRMVALMEAKYLEVKAVSSDAACHLRTLRLFAGMSDLEAVSCATARSGYLTPLCSMLPTCNMPLQPLPLQAE